MKVPEFLKKTGVAYATVLGTFIFPLHAIIPNTTVRIIISVILFFFVILLIYFSSLEQIPDDKRIISQWDLFGLLLKRHNQIMIQYFWYALSMFFMIFLFIVIVLFFKREELICLIRQDRWIILGYLFFIFFICAIYLWVHVYARKYYNLGQILWAQIENLRDELECKNLGGLNDNLDKEGKEKLYYLMLELRNGKMPDDFSREKYKKIIDAEATVIEQIKVKSNSPRFWNKICYELKKMI